MFRIYKTFSINFSFYETVYDKIYLKIYNFSLSRFVLRTITMDVYQELRKERRLGTGNGTLRREGGYSSPFIKKQGNT